MCLLWERVSSLMLCIGSPVVQKARVQWVMTNAKVRAAVMPLTGKSPRARLGPDRVEVSPLAAEVSGCSERCALCSVRARGVGSKIVPMARCAALCTALVRRGVKVLGMLCLLEATSLAATVRKPC